VFEIGWARVGYDLRTLDLSAIDFATSQAHLMKRSTTGLTAFR